MTVISGHSRYVVGIDLGTTNSVCAYVDTSVRGAPIEFHPIVQRLSETQVGPQVTLPSFLYLAGEHELPEAAMELPWDPDRQYVAGEFARSQGARVPGRLVSSAKSWLCHPAVERTAPILPWAALDDVQRISPVEASARYLAHIRDSWNHVMPEPMEIQDLVLTVPASFNEVARELTVAAARKAGLDRLRLLEEPQAAFYSWLSKFEKRWQDELQDVRCILICDIGGGTTDFTLIRMEEGELVRVAVGDHLLLGGDNMDLALAHHAEALLGTGEETEGVRLDTRQWGILVQECRQAKERLLELDAPEFHTVVIPGSGARILAGSLQVDISREDAVRLVLDGFYPQTDRSERALRVRRGLSEWGLPYTPDPAVPRHLAEFLHEHGGEVPDAVLFNGAALTPQRVRDRIKQILQTWAGQPIREIPNDWLDRAVAHGAAYFGQVLRGRGVRIGGGTGRSYYVRVADSGAEKAAVCVVSSRMKEGTEVTLEQPELSLLVGQPVSFPLVCSSARPQDEPGVVVEADGEEFDTLPPLRTVIQSDTSAREIPVRVRARVSEIGTLDLWCVDRQQKNQWRLQFDLRGEALPEASDLPVDREQLMQCRELIVRTFRTKASKVADIKPRTLLAAVEDRLKLRREEWPTPVLRELWEALDRIRDKRRRTDQYEAPWFNAVGWCMRPGFGYPLDEWRMDRLWDIFPQWLHWFKETAVRLEWWVMWRRVSGGLDADRQERLFTDISPLLLPGRKHIKMFPRPAPTQSEMLEIWRLAASLEKIPKADREKLGHLVFERLRRRREGSQDFWLLARLGARTPFAASPHYALPPSVVGEWVEELLTLSGSDDPMACFALSQMARYTGDRTRDLDAALRVQVGLHLDRHRPHLSQRVREAVELETSEQVELLGDSLPVGLRILSR